MAQFLALEDQLECCFEPPVEFRDKIDLHRLLRTRKDGLAVTIEACSEAAVANECQ